MFNSSKSTYSSRKKLKSKRGQASIEFIVIAVALMGVIAMLNYGTNEICLFAGDNDIECGTLMEKLSAGMTEQLGGLTVAIGLPL